MASWALLLWRWTSWAPELVVTVVIRLVRLQMDWFWRWVMLSVWFPLGCTAQDGHRVLEGVASVEEEAYGAGERETVFVLTPTADRAVAGQATRHILYVHGGGFVAANSAVLLHSVTTFCRGAGGGGGATVYSISYPLAPEHRFPRPVISVLRALAWVKETKGIDEVALIGDSAGGGLTSLVAAILLNPLLFRDFEKASGAPLSSWAFPRISSHVCIYGVLDKHSWKQRLETIGEAENLLARRSLGLCLWLYRSKQGVFGNQYSVCDVMDRVFRYPRTLFIAASKDPLIFSAFKAYEGLKQLRQDVQLHVFDARHAFFGLPPAAYPSWRSNALPCTQLINNFLNPAPADLSAVCSPVGGARSAIDTRR